MNNGAHIAVVGVGCRLPQAIDSIEKLWSALCAGLDAVEESSDAPWRAETAALFGADSMSPPVPSSGAFLGDVFGFDPAFFGISPREAADMDPQHRLLLETGWEALEHANIAADSLARSATGVFVGIGGDDYAQLAAAPERTDLLDAYSVTGVNRGMAAGRLAYLLKVHGPALAVDTTCSSSLVAVHLAVQSLRAGECDLALAAGCHLVRTPWSIHTRTLTKAISPTGVCRAFDADADGFVLGEGAVTVVLRRLDDARRDGDPVIGVIHGSAVNHDGPSSGLTAPNVEAQEAVIRSALRMAGMAPADVGYVEAHGTGTSLGDPVEAEALGSVYGIGRPADTPLRIGSVKTNFGHLEAASGILSLVKALLIVQRGVIPATLHHQVPNPRIDWTRANLLVQSRPGSWDGVRARIAGVSAFGLSGTNCHVIVGELAEAEETPPAPTAGGSCLLALSAKDEAALRALAGRYAAFLESSPAGLAEICASATRGRSHFRQRLALVADEVSEARESLLRFSATGAADGVRIGTAAARRSAAPVVFLLPEGDASIFRRFPDELYGRAGAFCQAVDAVVVAAERAGLTRERIVSGGADRHAALVAFTLRYALGTMWTAWGMAPSIVIAEKDTELPARCLTGELSLSAALEAITHEAQPPRPMVADRSGAAVAEVVVVRGDGPTDPVASAIARLRPLDSCVFLQIGGDPGLAHRFEISDGRALTWRAFTEAPHSQWQAVLGALADLFISGRPVNWDAVQPAARSVRLPTYPFRRSRLLLAGLPDPLPAGPADGGGDERGDTYVADIEDFLRLELARMLGMAEVDIAHDVPLLELGADSLVFAKLVQGIGERFGAVLSVRQLFEELHTVEEIARAVGGDSHEATVPALGFGRGPLTAGAEWTSAHAVETAAPAAGTTPSPAAVMPEHAAGESAAIEALQAQVRLLTARLAELQATTSGPAATGQRTDAGRGGYIAEVVRRFHARTAASRDHALRHQDRLVNNRRFVPRVDPVIEQIRYPICGERSAGSRMWDADGSEYIDLSMGFGAHLLGHSPEVVMRALRDQLATGIQLGSASRHAGAVAELLTGLTGTERVSFCVSGTEAVMTALRIARAATGRTKVVTFTRAYHGHFDGTLVVSDPEDPSGAANPMVAGTTRTMVNDVLVLPFDRASSLDVIAARSDEIAAVLVEPVQNGNPGLHPGPFLAALREITHKHGILLVFDEILTGFRVAPGGCQEWFGVRADLVTYGKTLAAGLPMAAVAGARDLLDLVDGGAWVGPARVPADRPLTYTAGTYANHPLALVAARAVLGHLVERGPRLQDELNGRSESMITRLNNGFTELGVPLSVANLGSFFRFAQNSNLSFVHQPVEMDILRIGLALRGVFVAEAGASFLSTAHSDADTDRVVAATLDAAGEMRDAGLWHHDRQREQPSGSPTTAVRPLPSPARPSSPPVDRDRDRERERERGDRRAGGAWARERAAPPDDDRAAGPALRAVPDLSLSYFGDSELIDPDEHWSRPGAWCTESDSA